ncbi:hypothetical protein M378DRAFT_61682, partial [Amanita muscaria Koide BX008]
SCAYDAILTIIHSIWTSEPSIWSNIFRTINDELLGRLASDFTKHSSGTMRLEPARDNLRRRLLKISPTQFAWGHFTALHHVLQYLLTTPSVTVESHLQCSEEHVTDISIHSNNTCCMVSAGATSVHTSIEQWMRNFREETHHKCTTCEKHIHVNFSFRYPLPLIAFDFTGQKPKIDSKINVNINGTDVQYKLRGIIYFGDNHFTSRIVSESGMTWFHDGIATGVSVIYEGDID